MASACAVEKIRFSSVTDPTRSGVNSRRSWRDISRSSRGEPSLEPVAETVIASHDRQEPRIARVGRACRKRQPVEGTRRDDLAGDLQTELIAEVGGHPHAAALTAGRVVHALVDAHV